MYEGPPINEKKNLKNRIDDSIQNLIEKKVLDNESLSEEQERIVSLAKQRFIDCLDPEAKDFLEQISDEEFEEVPRLILRYTNPNQEGSDKKISLDSLRNFLLYRKVYGYGHPDLIKREEENPNPSAEEVLLGCYKEQIEAQTRSAVFILRSKGYDTMQSGFYNKEIGSQFFDFYGAKSVSVPENLLHEMEERFEVLVTTKNSSDRTKIELIPKKFKELKEWEEALTYFSEQIPQKGEEKYLSSGMGVDFAYKAIQKFPIEDVLKTATDEHEATLIKRLYECKTKKDIIHLFKIESDTAERMIIEDSLEEEAKKDIPDNLKNAIKQIWNNFQTGSVVIDRENIEESIHWIEVNQNYLSEKYRETKEEWAYLITVERSLVYLKQRLLLKK